MTFLAEHAFVAYSIAFSFDWLNQCASGMVKGTGWQQNNTYSGLLSLVTLSLSWYLARHEGLGLTGLWVGYGAYSAILTVVNYGILIFCVDWSRADGKCGRKG